jgi:hypothetical protein
MTPQQIARLAREWYRANKADPIETVKRTCWQYAYSEEHTAEALAELFRLMPEFQTAH